MTHVEREGDRWVLVFVREFRHPREAVWAALTDPGQLDAWAPFRPDRDLATPGPATLTMVDGDTEVPLRATVLRAEPPALLEYTWDADLLRWELAETGAGTTRLTLRHAVQGRDLVPKVAAGWHLCFDVMDRRIGGEPGTAVRGRAAMEHGWQDLHDTYAATLIRYEWRGSFDNKALNALHAEGFGHRVLDDDWWGQVNRHSLGWVCAFDGDDLVGFVNVAWDGGVHAFVLDTLTTERVRRRGIGRELVALATREASAAGCEWLHVDFDEHLTGFYFDACGFTGTPAGLIALR